jgi:hypothetical protein
MRLLFRTRLGRYVELGLDIAEDLLCGYLGVDALERRVRRLEVLAERMEREEEARARRGAGFPRQPRMRRAG